MLYHVIFIEDFYFKDRSFKDSFYTDYVEVLDLFGNVFHKRMIILYVIVAMYKFYLFFKRERERKRR